MSLTTVQIGHLRNDLKRERNRLATMYEFLHQREIHGVSRMVSDAIDDIDRAWETLGKLTAVDPREDDEQFQHDYRMGTTPDE